MMAKFLLRSILDVESVLNYYDVVGVSSYLAWLTTHKHPANRDRQMMQAEELTASILPEPPRIPPHRER